MANKQTILMVKLNNQTAMYDLYTHLTEKLNPIAEGKALWFQENVQIIIQKDTNNLIIIGAENNVRQIKEFIKKSNYNVISCRCPLCAYNPMNQQTGITIEEFDKCKLGLGSLFGNIVLDELIKGSTREQAYRKYEEHQSSCPLCQYVHNEKDKNEIH